MKSIYVFEEESCGTRMIRGVYATKELAYKAVNDYLDYLNQDAIENLGGLRLDAESLRIQCIKESLEIAFSGNDEYPYSNYSDLGIIITKRPLIESEEDLIKKKKEGEIKIEF